jgi:hypothetical protein
MLASVSIRMCRSFAAVRALIERHGSIEALPEGSFCESGTMVRPAIMTLGAAE